MEHDTEKIIVAVAYELEDWEYIVIMQVSITIKNWTKHLWVRLKDKLFFVSGGLLQDV